MQNIKKFLPLIVGAFLLVAVSIALSMFSSWQEQKEIAWITGLTDRHPEGEQYVQELFQARKELNDKNKDNDFSAWLRMGVNLNLLKEKEKALEWYGKALKQDPTNLLALNNSANIYDELGKYEKAEETWLQLIAAYPDKPSFYRSLGYLYWYKMRKSPQEIEALFKKGLEASNNDPDLIRWLMAYFSETGDNEKWVEYANLLNEQAKK